MKTIELIVKQTKAGDDYHVFKMEDGKFLSVFKFDTRFPEINVGTDLPDDVLIYDPQYSNYKLKPLPKPAGGPRTGGNAATIAKAQETKREDIEAAQDRKERSIRLSQAMGGATQIALASLKDQPFPTDDDFKAEWTKWCKWLIAQGNQPFI